MLWSSSIIDRLVILHGELVSVKSLVLGFGDESGLLFYGVVIVVSGRKLCSQASGNRRALKLLQHPFPLGKKSYVLLTMW